MNCEDCEVKIPARRMKARPEATLCVDCQERAEKLGQFERHRMGHDVKFKGDDVDMVSYLVPGGNVVKDE